MTNDPLDAMKALWNHIQCHDTYDTFKCEKSFPGIQRVAVGSKFENIRLILRKSPSNVHLNGEFDSRMDAGEK